MESVTKSDDKLFENSIKYLHGISNLKALNVPALKSFYLTKSRLMELRKAIYLPSNVTRTSVRCQRCFINLLDGPANYRVKAEHKKSRFAKKLLSKFHNNKPLTKYQRKYLKKLNDFDGNQLAITCKFCTKESLIKLEKPKKLVHPKKVSPQKKKIRKKDKFCGLNEEAVLSLAPHNIRDLDTSHVGAKNRRKSGFKLSKTVNRVKNKQVEVIKENIKESTIKHQKKSKKLQKLSQCLNSSDKVKSSSNLKHFLQSL